jgi:hypothetical protein
MRTFVIAVVAASAMFGAMLPANAWVGNGTRGGSCEPAPVNFLRQNPPNGAICERQQRHPTVKRYYQQRRVVHRQPAYYPPQRTVRAAPCGSPCGVPAPSPCGTCDDEANSKYHALPGIAHDEGNNQCRMSDGRQGFKMNGFCVAAR